MSQPDTTGNHVQNYFNKNKITSFDFDIAIVDVYELTAKGQRKQAIRLGITMLGSDKVISDLLKASKKAKDTKKPKKNKPRQSLDSIEAKMMSIASARLTKEQYDLFRQAF